MKSLLTVTAILEGITGIGLLLMPAVLAKLLLGDLLDRPAALTFARVGGAALVAIGTACWLARAEPVRSLVKALLIYNIGAAAILTHAAISLELFGAGLWPTVILHTVLAGWCAVVLKSFHLHSTTRIP